MHEWLDSYEERLKANEGSSADRHVTMLQANPKYVLKNYMLQEAIEAAEHGDFALVNDLFVIAQRPFDEHPLYERWAAATPDNHKNRKLSCFS